MPDIWWLKEEDKVVIDGKVFKVKKIEFIESCHPEHCKDEKTFYLTDDYALVVNEDQTDFFKIERPNKNTENFKKLRLNKVNIVKG